MIHLYIYFLIIYVDKFWFYIFVRIYFLFGVIKENKGPGRAWPESDTRTGLQCRGQWQVRLTSARTVESGAGNDGVCRIDRQDSCWHVRD